MPYSPESIKKKITERELALKKAIQDSLKVKRAEYRLKANEKKRIEKELATFNRELGKLCIEAALNGNNSCFFKDDPRVKYAKRIENGSFEFFTHELFIEELFDSHRDLFYSYGLNDSLLNFDDVEDCVHIDDVDHHIEHFDSIDFDVKNLYKRFSYLYRIFEKGYDKINFMSDSQKRFFSAIAASRFNRGYDESQIKEIMGGLKDLYVILSKHKSLSFIEKDEKVFFKDPQAAIKELVSNIRALEDIFSEYEFYEKISKIKIAKKNSETQALKKHLRSKKYEVFEISWNSGGGSYLKDNQTDFFIAWVLECLSDDANGNRFFESVFSFIENSISEGFSSCQLDFEEYSKPYRENDHRQGIFSEDILMLMSLEQIEGIFKCLGYRTKLKKVQPASKKNIDNLICYYELILSW